MPEKRRITQVFLVLLSLSRPGCEGFVAKGDKRTCHDSTRRRPPWTLSLPANANGQDVTSLQKKNIPDHVAFVCDGNSRWAEKRSLPSSAGHLAGADRLLDSLKTLRRTGVTVATFYGFSSENWRRPPAEVRDVLDIIEQSARMFYDRALAENIQVKILGDLDDERIPGSLREILQKIERDTSYISRDLFHNEETNTRPGRKRDKDESLTLCLAINYGGRQDILHASIKLAQEIASGAIDATKVSEEDFSSLLCTADIPDPDLIIRTGGERRLSNFLLWNAAYTELYFTDTLWPDFSAASLEEALTWFAGRSRRFGGRAKVPSGVTRL